MRILIANDDGVYSPGICALAETAQQFGEVRVVAPDLEGELRLDLTLASGSIDVRNTYGCMISPTREADGRMPT